MNFQLYADDSYSWKFIDLSRLSGTTRQTIEDLQTDGKRLYLLIRTVRISRDDGITEYGGSNSLELRVFWCATGAPIGVYPVISKDASAPLLPSLRADDPRLPRDGINHATRISPDLHLRDTPHPKIPAMSLQLIPNGVTCGKKTWTFKDRELESKPEGKK